MTLRQFEEKIEFFKRPTSARKPHPLNGKLVGRVHWKETIIDDSNGKPFTLERSQIVRVDGEWVV